MSKILVLGCGLMGPVIAKDCSESDYVTAVVGCDIDEEQLKRCSKIVSNAKFETSKLDLTDYGAIVKRLEGFDVVVNASASEFSLDVLKASMETGVDVVDLSDVNYPLKGDIHKKVEKAGITAIPGCGVDPGLADILSGHAMDLMDDVNTVFFACGGLPRDLHPPLNYKIVFGGKKMPIRFGKVPMIINGEQVNVERYSDVEPVHLEGFEDMEAFYDGHPSSLLILCKEKGVKTFKGKTIRYKGFVDNLKFLLDLGVISSEPVFYHGQKIVPLDFFHELVYPLVKFDPQTDRDITVLLVRVEGKKNNSDLCVTYEMVDHYDEEKNITSMAKTTGYTAALVARMLARGEISQKGIQWPVNIIKGELFDELIRDLKKRGVEVKGDMS